MTWSCKLEGRSIRVRAVRLEAPSEITAQFEKLLSPDERERARRFRFDHLRDAFTLARGALRVILGGYLGVPPGAIPFRYGAKGKPALDLPRLLDFNMSHSGALAVYAFTLGCELGVDVERLHRIEEMQQIARRFFCPEEAEDLASVPEAERERAFLHCWTRKEAYIKAIGDGLSAPLDDFRVSLQPGRAQFLHIGHRPEAAREWMLHDLELAPGYVGALAYYDSERPVLVSRVIDPAELLPMIAD
jgi:4'-phosphopantetheinyl transferase